MYYRVENAIISTNYMRIAFFHELPKGGARRGTNELAKQLKKNHEVDLYIVDEINDKNEKNFYNKIFFYTFKPKEWSGKNWKVRFYKDSIELIKLYNLHKKIAEDIKKEKYDLIFANASKFTQAPFILRFNPDIFKVYYCHDPHYRIIYESILDISDDLDLVRKYYEKINRLVRKNIDRGNVFGANLILANSIFTKEKIKETYDRGSKVSYLGVDSLFFKPEKIIKDIDILYIGSYEPVDGHSLLNEAKKYMKHKAEIKEIMIENEWISDDKKLRSIYQRSKIVVCLAYNEPFGLVPLEAMSCGCAVIAVDEGGYKESVINDKTGFLIPRDSKILAKKMDFLLSNKKILNYFQKNAREEILKKWTWDKSGKELQKILKQTN